MKILAKGLLFLILLPLWVWGILALHFSGPGPPWLNLMLVCVFGAILPAVFIISRSFVKSMAVCVSCFIVLLVWWITLEPTNNKDWAPDVARIAHGELEGDILVVHNVRDFRYFSESSFQEHWQTRTYDLSRIQGLDMFLSYWASDNIAHLILSWDFGGDDHLAISIETRKDKTQQYSSIKGFFKQFELSYVAADERDLIRLRTNYRKERVYLYRLKTSKEKARALLEDYLVEMNRLVNEPQFYNALTRNCATTAHLHVEAVHPESLPVDWRLIFSGHLDELIYEYQAIKGHGIPFAELRERSRVDQRMQTYDGDNFSHMMRQVAQ